MNEDQVGALFRKFASPLGGYAATSTHRKELAGMLVRNLWKAMIAGTKMEEETWKVLKTTGKLDEDSLQLVQQLYFEQMKAAVSDKELAGLRKRYQILGEE